MADSGTKTTTVSGGRGTPWRSVALWVAALLVIVLGFVDLWRGGTTLAPILLVAGYCILVPLAILR